MQIREHNDMLARQLKKSGRRDHGFHGVVLVSFLWKIDGGTPYWTNRVWKGFSGNGFSNNGQCHSLLRRSYVIQSSHH